MNNLGKKSFSPARLPKALLIIGALAISPIRAHAEVGAAAEFGALQAEVQKIRSELNETKTEVASLKEKLTELTAEPPAFSPVSVTLDQSSADDFVLGKADAPITIMEFFDYQCGYCGLFHEQVFPELKKAYIDTGKVRFIFRDFPISGDQGSVLTAAFADCAGKQGKYLEAHDILFEAVAEISAGKAADVAKRIPGLDGAKLTACMASAPYTAPRESKEFTPSKELAADVEEGTRMNIDGTPAFFVFKTAGPGAEVTGQLVGGAQPVEIFEQVFQSLEQGQ
jgi:protein-disulfide isomerase